ncbi:DUF1737 domain-containing protein [Teredinibacter turnerae]|uniref:Uncharacterized protein n=1 Tax=Teredinibacter turnerae (strain ATCC 39867 / T7901) TaxID=377629 RepID=C5BNP6_TERTT|nr:DUF1737 domain-containing protein [Teredinibacter turnerae]ACR13281.1 hypothetical protein TERTU_0616 [Teredinibacter turnerae T7901]
MKRAEYKIISGPSGLPQLEDRITEFLNKGWKPVGGIAFNAGYPYQAIARVVTVDEDDNLTRNPEPAL